MLLCSEIYPNMKAWGFHQKASEASCYDPGRRRSKVAHAPSHIWKALSWRINMHWSCHWLIQFGGGTKCLLPPRWSQNLQSPELCQHQTTNQKTAKELQIMCVSASKIAINAKIWRNRQKPGNQFVMLQQQAVSKTTTADCDVRKPAPLWWMCAHLSTTTIAFQ